MTFVARSVRYVLRKRVRTIVLLIILTIITASMPDVYLEVQHPCWSCNSNSSSANASAGVR